MLTPVGPYGAQRRLQHEPPHEGGGLPGMKIVPPSQSTPSGIEQFAEPVGG
jgi:hypothetical protein